MRGQHAIVHADIVDLTRNTDWVAAPPAADDDTGGGTKIELLERGTRLGGDPRPQYFMYGAEAQLVGTGRLQVLTGGKLIDGTWSRPDIAHPAKLLDAAGAEIRLAPGQTWVELPEPSYSVTVTP